MRAALGALVATIGACLFAAAPAGANHSLTLTVTKTAGGTVTSGENPREIDCGTDCTGEYRHVRSCDNEPGFEPVCINEFDSATLTATPAPGYRFTGWSGACSGTASTCDLEMNEDRTAHAAFANNAPSVSIEEPANGIWTNGTVSVRATATDDSGLASPPTARLSQLSNSAGYFETASGGMGGGPSVFTSGLTAIESLSIFGVGFNFPDHAQGGRVEVTACDAAGACASAQRFVGIDQTEPTLTPGPGPSDLVGPGEQVWKFEAGDATSGLAPGFPECFVDTGQFRPCATNPTSGWEIRRTYSTSGFHTWAIMVRDRAGNVRVAQHNFTVDADPPDTSINSGPDDGSSSTATAATFGYSSADATATFRCRVYTAGTAPPVFGNCSGPGAAHTTSILTPGTYRFEVAARDAVGNADPTPAGRTFTVEPLATGGAGTDNTGTESGGGGGGGSAPADTPGPPPADTPGLPPAGTSVATPAQQGSPPPARSKPGKCSKLKGKKRAACIRKTCGKYKKGKKKSAKKYRACVKSATRR